MKDFVLSLILVLAVGAAGLIAFLLSWAAVFTATRWFWSKGTIQIILTQLLVVAAVTIGSYLVLSVV